MKFSHHRSQNSPWSWEAEEMFCHWCKLWLHMSLVLRSFFGLTVHLLFYVYVIFPRIKSWAGNVIDLDFTKFHPHQWDKKNRLRKKRRKEEKAKKNRSKRHCRLQISRKHWQIHGFSRNNGGSGSVMVSLSTTLQGFYWNKVHSSILPGESGHQLHELSEFSRELTCIDTPLLKSPRKYWARFWRHWPSHTQGSWTREENTAWESGWESAFTLSLVPLHNGDSECEDVILR